MHIIYIYNYIYNTVYIYICIFEATSALNVPFARGVGPSWFGPWGPSGLPKKRIAPGRFLRIQVSHANQISTFYGLCMCIKMEVYPLEMEVLYGFIWENHGNISGIYPLVI